MSESRDPQPGEPQISDVVIDREAGVLMLRFDDGVDCVLALEAVRAACPCAACRGRREAGQEAWTPRENGPGLAVSDAELAGAWGLSIRWNDGHDTGIYPWTSLRRWAMED